MTATRPPNRSPSSTRARSGTSTTPATTACSWSPPTASRAFDVIFAEPIPREGTGAHGHDRLLVEALADLARTTSSPPSRPSSPTARPPARRAEALAGRAMLVRRAEMLPHRVHRPRLPGRLGVQGVRA